MSADFHSAGPFSADTSVAASDTVDLRNARGAMVLVPAGSALIAITPHVASDAEGSDDSTWYEYAGGAITVAAGKATELPSGLFAAGLTRFVGNAAGNFRVIRKG